MESLSSLAVPGVLLLVTFLSYSSQILFRYIEPYSLGLHETIIFNLLLVCLLICYARTCIINPGVVPFGWEPAADGVDEANSNERAAKPRQRYCSKCSQFKPPRSHHCKVCRRCIAKMDHHCPWTQNCVSHLTIPHFLRFIFYADAAMGYLQYFLWLRLKILWDHRRFPSYLGPSVPAMIHLLLLIVINSITLFALGILLIRVIWSVGSNTTTIEGWEIERHEALLRRARVLGGYLNGPNGENIRITRQEFPYDIGIWENFKQAMGTGNIIAWFWPFAHTPSLQSGLEFPVNGFEDSSMSWPPPDPDRIPRIKRKFKPDDAFTYKDQSQSQQEEIEAFRRRQEMDFQRKNASGNQIYRRQPFHKRALAEAQGYTYEDGEDDEGEEAWRNSEGERLDDFGVEEDVEFYDEDDLPLAQIVGSRRVGKLN